MVAPYGVYLLTAEKITPVVKVLWRVRAHKALVQRIAMQIEIRKLFHPFAPNAHGIYFISTTLNLPFSSVL